MKLVVIEGAGKVKTVEKYLGKGYKVFATKGHIRDLPAKTLAVNVKNNFEPKYEILPDKKETVKELKRLAEKADEIYLATDPDREGEAISWHIANVLGLSDDKKVRVEFNEISQKAVQKGLAHPREINLNLVDAQQARRVLDRLVGYKVSPILCKKIQNNLSAGRVQSATLGLIVEREREIRNFKPEEYWPFGSVVQNGDGPKFKISLTHKNAKKVTLKSKEDVDGVVSDLSGEQYVVSKVKKSVTKSHALPPFITSTMQQDALNKLGMTLQQTSQSAQSLYEGVELKGEGKVALITYIRTDSTRVSPDAITAARAFIEKKYGGDYVPEKPNYYASKKSAQDAHEAIRPITLERTPESVKDSLKANDYKLYKLIYDRFLASQMSEAKYNSVSVEVKAGSYTFAVKGKTPLFAGYTVVYNGYVEKNEDDDQDGKRLPVMEEGDVLTFVEYKYEQKFTKPPTRYTEASLVKLMEEKGIGRPATYVPTVTLLSSREYIVKEGKYLVATKLGETVTDMMIRYFPDIMDVNFTANMEEKLDEIEFGGKVWQKVIDGFYGDFEEKLIAASGDSFTLKPKSQATDIKCDKCGAFMVVRHGQFGDFLGCSNYPKCKNTMQLNGEPKSEQPRVAETHEDDTISLRPQNDSATVQAEAQTVSGEVCEKCGRPMVIRKGKYGNFLGCSGYPECKNIRKINGAKTSSENESVGVCPECGKPLRKISTAKATFYGCTGYPDCRFTSFDPVSDQKCPKCGSYLVVKTEKKGKSLKCGNKDCDYTKELTSTDEK